MKDITYCSRTSCAHIDCPRHQSNIPIHLSNLPISIADLNDGSCFDEAVVLPKMEFCEASDCRNRACRFHMSKIAQHANDQPYDIVPLDLGCYISPAGREELLQAICDGTQKTNYQCNDTCKALCRSDGHCAYCTTIADSIEEVFGFVRTKDEPLRTM